MKIAASNIAWKVDHDEVVARVLRSLGFGGVEIAPTVVWPEPLSAPEKEVARYRAWWEAQGIEVVSMQALLFGRPDLTVFGTESARQATLDYLAGMVRLGAGLGARVLVFGAPRNRLVGNLSPDEVTVIASAFFREIGDVAARYGIAFCIEPNPARYGCDFVRTSAEGLALVRAVGSDGFGLHLDAAGMTLSNEEPGTTLPALGAASHFHISEVDLGPIGSGTVQHEDFAAGLRNAGYDRWLAVEMRAPPGSLAQLEASLSVAKDAYV